MNSELVREDRNNMFSSFRGNDLKELLNEVSNFLLEYRKILNISSNNVTFGCEIEYERVNRAKVDKFIQTNLPMWESKKDGSLSYGGEITSPIMVDNEKNFNDLKKVCDFLKSNRADTFHNAGGHIHVGAKLLGEDVDAWRLFLKLYTAYENILFRFSYGDKDSGRSKILQYAKPVADELYSKMDRLNIADYLFYIELYVPKKDRRYALNFCNVKFEHINDIWKLKNTLEFRCPNASINPIIWQNNINAFTKMIVSSKDKVMDEEFLDYKLNNEFISYNNDACLYEIINLKNVLEFVDLVFDNNLDKVYFLRQYLKDFKDSYGYTAAIPSKSFCKE